MAEAIKPDGAPVVSVKITTVTYGRTINIGGYETARIELAAQVCAGQTYAQVLDVLKDLLDKEERIVRKEFEKI